MRAPLRPTLEFTVSEPAERLLERMARALRAADCPLSGSVDAERIELHVPASRQHLWSPELRIDVQAEEDGCRLRGIYGPHPHVWLTFVALYGILAFCALGALVFAMAQWSLGRGASGLYVFASLVLVALAVRLLASLGQGLGGEQMDELRTFLDRAIEQGSAAGQPLTSSKRAATRNCRKDAAASVPCTKTAPVLRPTAPRHSSST